MDAYIYICIYITYIVISKAPLRGGPATALYQALAPCHSILRRSTKLYPNVPFWRVGPLAFHSGVWASGGILGRLGRLLARLGCRLGRLRRVLGSLGRHAGRDNGRGPAVVPRGCGSLAALADYLAFLAVSLALLAGCLVLLAGFLAAS